MKFPKKKTLIIRGDCSVKTRFGGPFCMNVEDQHKNQKYGPESVLHTNIQIWQVCSRVPSWPQPNVSMLVALLVSH